MFIRKYWHNFFKEYLLRNVLAVKKLIKALILTKLGFENLKISKILKFYDFEILINSILNYILCYFEKLSNYDY